MAWSRYGRRPPHAEERRGPGRIDGLQHAEAVEDARALGAQILAADLGTGKGRPIEDDDVEPTLAEQDRGGGARRAGAHDDDVRPAHDSITASKRPSLACRSIRGAGTPAFSARVRISSDEYARRTDRGPS